MTDVFFQESLQQAALSKNNVSRWPLRRALARLGPFLYPVFAPPLLSFILDAAIHPCFLSLSFSLSLSCHLIAHSLSLPLVPSNSLFPRALLLAAIILFFVMTHSLASVN